MIHESSSATGRFVVGRAQRSDEQLFFARRDRRPRGSAQNRRSIADASADETDTHRRAARQRQQIAARQGHGARFYRVQPAFIPSIFSINARHRRRATDQREPVGQNDFAGAVGKRLGLANGVEADDGRARHLEEGVAFQPPGERSQRRLHPQLLGRRMQPRQTLGER